MLPALGWVTARANAVATAASTAVPPAHRTSMPACDAMKFWETTMPCFARMGWPPVAERGAGARAAARTRTPAREWFIACLRRGEAIIAPRCGHGGRLDPMLTLAIGLALAARAAPASPAGPLRTLRVDYLH